MRSLLAALVLVGTTASAATLQVGSGKPYATPCAAIAAAQDGDVIEIDAGLYSGDVCAVPQNHLTLRGVGGLAHLDAAGQSYGGKAIWVIQGSDATVENIEFSGAQVTDNNGAGIRQEGVNLTVRGSYFHDNQDGILAGDNPTSTILIEASEFDHNGAGDGMSHNMYINHVQQFTLRASWSHRANVGQLVKSRAYRTDILYNRLTDESDGTTSYEIDIPNGGTAYVIGNVIEQGPMSQNSNIVEIGVEGNLNPSTQLYFVNNTVVNDLGHGTFVLVGSGVTTASVLTNNIFSGGGTVCSQASAVLTTNFSTGDPLLVDPATFDYHLQAGSPCIDAGSDPGTGMGVALTPIAEYLHPASEEGRATVGTIDIGAYERGGATVEDGGAMTSDMIATMSDMIVAASDGFTPQADQGFVTRDGGAGTSDAASAGSSTSGCGCRVADSAPGSSAAPILLGLCALLGLALRRRRAR